MSYTEFEFVDDSGGSLMRNTQEGAQKENSNKSIDILSHLRKINEQQWQMSAKLDTLVDETISMRNEITAIKANFCVEAQKTRIILPTVPFQTLGELLSFDEVIKEENAFKTFVAELLGSNEKKFDKFIRLAWRQLLNDNVAKQCCWRGTDNKKCIRGLQVTLGIRKAFKLKFNLEDEDFNRTTQKFFQYAQDRVTRTEEIIAKRRKE